MKAIVRFQSVDGSEWASKSDAAKRDALCWQIDAAMRPLGAIPKAVKDGKGWLQHNLETVNKAKDAILKICRSEGFVKSYPAFKSRGRDCHPFSIIGRILDDHGGPLSEAWARFACIDAQGREHQQPFYAYGNGPLAEHFCVQSRD